MPRKYTISEFIEKATKKHNNQYDYKNVIYKSANSKIEITCKIHGSFHQKPNNHILGQGCPICGKIKKAKSKTRSREQYIELLEKVHDKKYDYSAFVYNGYHEKCNIICPIHGVFSQTLSSHLSGRGCSKCKYQTFSENYGKNPTGWTLTLWKKAGSISKRFDGFKVYIIRCWNETEEFYKIGRTYLSVKYRFIGNLPYNYEILKEIKGEASEIFKLENKLKKENKHYKYVPKLEFGGMYECFSNIKDINYDN